jgi:type I restriction enzyme M protein
LTALQPKDANVLTAKFLYLVLDLQKQKMAGLMKGAANVSMKVEDLAEFQIPLPALETQKEIVAEIEGYQKVIAGARAVLDQYRPNVPIHPDWPMVSIKEIASVESGFGFPEEYQGKNQGEIPFLKVSDMNLADNETKIVRWNNTVSRAVLRELKAKAFPAGTVIFPKIGGAIATNKKRILTRDSTYDNNVMGIVPNTKRVLPDYLHTYLLAFDLSLWASDAHPPSMRKTVVEEHAIPLPPLATQQTIVAEIEAEQALVAANRELITRFGRKIQATLARIWGEEEPPALYA